MREVLVISQRTLPCNTASLVAKRGVLLVSILEDYVAMLAQSCVRDK